MNRPPISILLIVMIFISLVIASLLYGHCEIPCGIFNDMMRIELLKEHILTVEKSMNMIKQLSTENPVNYNQLIRWVTNKENHADEIQHIVSQYFMTQRIKPVEATDKTAYQGYIDRLALLHEMLIYAMKAKQTTDQINIDKLRELVDRFSQAYFSPEELKHLREHHD